MTNSDAEHSYISALGQGKVAVTHTRLQAQLYRQRHPPYLTKFQLSSLLKRDQSVIAKREAPQVEAALGGFFESAACSL